MVNSRARCPLSPAVSRASAGALELITVHSVRNAVEVLRDAKASGYAIIALDFHTRAYKYRLELKELGRSHQKRIFLIGSENEGVSSELKALTDFAIYIDPCPALDGSSPRPLLDSLNVSVAAGILFNHIHRLTKGGAI